MAIVDLVKKVFKSKRRAKKKAGSKTKKRTLKKIKKKTTKKASRKAGLKKLKKPPKLEEKLPSLEKPKEKEIGRITHYFGKIEVGIIKLKSRLKVGDKIHIKGVHDDFTQVVTSMQYNHKDILQAKGGLEVGIKVNQKVHENDRVYLVAK